MQNNHVSCEWVCYLIRSLDTNQTYIGATNNPRKRLYSHNKIDPNTKRTGAKRTHNQIWIPILIVSGFNDKKSCLSFEAGWKRLSQSRSNKKILNINNLSCININYTKDPRINRIIDLLFFMNNFTMINNKFIANVNLKYPIIQPSFMMFINVFMEDWIHELPWPSFTNIRPGEY